MSRRRIPRAIAPEVTITTSSPASWRRATSAQTPSTTSARSSPPSSATMLEPSLMTMRRATVRLELPERGPRVELEHRSCKLNVITRLKSGLFERADHAHLPEPLLDVAQGLLVLDVVPSEQPLHRRPGH